jgi:predicted acetyltransferase
MSLSDFEVRPFDESTRDQYIDLCQFCFGMPETSRNRYFIHEEELACSLGAWDGDRLACGMWYWPYDMRVRDQFVRMAGVAAVATWPEYRNRGLVRDLMTELQVKMREDGRPVSVLAPFKWSFYYDLGWAPTFETLILRFEPQKIRRFEESGYKLRRVELDESWQIFEQLHMQYSQKYNGTLCRSKDYWKRRMFEAPGQGRMAYLVEQGDEPKGYLIGRLDNFANGQDSEMYRVIQAVWLDGAAQRAIFAFLASMRDQVKRIHMFVPQETHWIQCFREMYFETRLEPKMMTKVVDVKAALEALPYESELDGTMHLTMKADPAAPWNDGSWNLTWTAGGLKMNKAEASGDAVAMTPQALAQLYMGYRSVSDLQDSGDLAVSDQQAQLLELAYPRYPTYIDDWF